jgi:hypothetical protein
MEEQLETVFFLQVVTRLRSEEQLRLLEVVVSVKIYCG